ncbi:MAG TPA: Ig-like domain-containing protein [Candidatus Acutalibacter pullistercoris]|uniref:Ig-like domain-containing protein n=1 Tax=Candidatus Acutalibacter pullistercoris TaxID=2838418 RepID=A0A9D1YBV0_9FIRM|nr:Ig-like domain-containing protein [Candidatus Acutalibacter pullistercoris]
MNLDDATWGDESLVTTLDKDGKPVVDQGDPKEYHFAWSSSDPDVATIDKTGKITILTNGSVQFTLTALNGDLMLPALDENGDPVIGEDGETVLVTSRFDYLTPEILVGIGNSPTLTIPESLRTTTVRGGQSATVLWSSNLTEKNRDYAKEDGEPDFEKTATTFTVNVYKDSNWNTSENEPNPNASPVDEPITVSSSMESVKSSVTSGSSGPSSSTSPTATVTTGTTSKTTGRRCRTASPATTTRLYSRMKSPERQDPSCFL